MDELPRFEPVKVTCTTTDCEADHHCYRPKRWKKSARTDACRECGDASVDFGVTRSRKAPPATMVCELDKELIRHVFLTAPLDTEARRELRRRGFDALRAGARNRLRQRIGKKDDAWDGRQTPKVGSVLNFAQHATATCCRKCLNYWYDIPRGRELTEAELDFCENLVLHYLDRREVECRIAATGRDKPSAAPAREGAR